MERNIVDKMMRRFPLVLDDEPVISPLRVMHLYDNEDLIPNIRGSYHDRDYQDVTQNFHFVTDEQQAKLREPERVETIEAGKSYAALAREKAKRDVKEKRQAFLSKEVSKPIKSSFHKDSKTSSLSTKNHTKDEVTDLVRAASKLHQDSYILAELPRVYEQPQNQSVSKTRKNSYDFLKKSQIYNYEDNQNRKERQIARELNLTRFD
ncbi:hypothetical protein [Streptococcus plurextorum]|uniref:hypothetical protein n=1 Tax=Streptococcus plurextorum TaxID=456876 RepID=UPI0004221CA4|nr:hypothetical protein [Streptococcus plurextorum]